MQGGSSMPDCKFWGLNTCSCPCQCHSPTTPAIRARPQKLNQPRILLLAGITHPNDVPDTPNGQSPPSQSLTHPTPQLATASAVFCGSKGSSGGGVLAVLTAQKRQPRVHVSPISMMVAVAATAGRGAWGGMDISDSRCTRGGVVRSEHARSCN
jgi:hypothetical protein